MRRLTALPAALVGGAVVLVVTTAVPAGTAGSARRAPVSLGPAGHVVVVAVPGLAWEDVATGRMPGLSQLAGRGAAGLLSVKVVPGVTRCGDGELAVSAGSRTRGAPSGCRIDPQDWPRLRRVNATSTFRAPVGALGDALAAAGVRTAAVGDAAVPLLAGRAGGVDAVTAGLPEALTRARVVAVLLPQLYAAAGSARTAARDTVDAAIGEVAATVPADTLLLVAGISDTSAGRARLHVAVAAGAGVPRGRLTSASTGRTPYVQLVDLAPTLLAAVGAAAPAAMIGQPMRAVPGPPGDVAGFVDADAHARAGSRIASRVGFAVILAVVALLLVAITALRRPGTALLRAAALAVAVVPVATYLAQVVPWWRSGPWLYAVLVAGIAVTTGAAGALLPRRVPWGAIGVLAVAFGALVLDQVAGAPLQLAAPLGDSPLVAGRFHGIGNIAFAVLATSSLLLAALLAARMRRRAVALVVAGSIGLLALAVDGLPVLGDDLGGVLSLAPAVALLLLGLAGVRLRPVRVAVVAGAAAVLAVLLALADYARPADQQTHMGRFVGQLLHGDAGVVLQRKLDANVHQLWGSYFTTFLVLVAAFVVMARDPLRRAVREVPGLRAGLVAATVAAVLGGLLNDSGVAVTGVAAAVAVPTVVALAAGRRDASPPVPPSPDPASPG